MRKVLNKINEWVYECLIGFSFRVDFLFGHYFIVPNFKKKKRKVVESTMGNGTV